MVSQINPRFPAMINSPKNVIVVDVFHRARLFDQGLRETGGMNPFLPLILTVTFPQEKIHVFFLETGMSGKSNGEILIKNYTEV